MRALPVGEDSVGEGSLPLQGDDDHRVDGAGNQDVLGNRGQLIHNCFRKPWLCHCSLDLYDRKWLLATL